MRPSWNQHRILVYIFIVFVNAPHILLPSEVFGEPQLEGVVEEAPEPNTALRCWWRANVTPTKALRTSILAIRDLFVTQRFDVCFVLTYPPLLYTDTFSLNYYH